MEMNLKTRFLILACVLSTAGIISAAPSLPVTKVPVTPSASFTGPTNDTHAVMGQWFMNVDSSKPEYRTHEFYDNTTNSGGGYRGHGAIYGAVKNVVHNNEIEKKIVSFEVEATVSNDVPALSGWLAGTNSNGEALSISQQYTNVLRKVILTVDFAVAGKVPNWLESNVYPYRDSTNGTYITSTNHNFTGWYGNPVTNPSPDSPSGVFLVPGWNFGDIPPGGASTRTLQFMAYNFNEESLPIENYDPRYPAITQAESSGADIFINRSLSLKISEWISDPALDEGDGAATNSNVSVFHDTDEDIHQVVSIASVKTQLSPLSITLYTTGSTNGISQQIMQVSTNLTTNTWWMSVATNEAAWPIPQTNFWSYTNTVWPVQFYRIIQP
jgi:hypothetical protein